MLFNHRGLSFQYTNTIYTGIPDRIISSPIPTSHGFTYMGKVTRKAAMMKNVMGRMMLTCEYNATDPIINKSSTNVVSNK
jgi:hypothetical protein